MSMRIFLSMKIGSLTVIPTRRGLAQRCHAALDVGDSVRERFPFATANREIGTVVKRYEFENQYRYVVKFTSGREDVFFETELLAVPKPVEG